MSTRPDVAAIKARAEAADLPRLNAYGRMELSSYGVRPPLEHRRVVETVELLDATLEALSLRMADTRALCARVEALEAALRRLGKAGAVLEEAIHSEPTMSGHLRGLHISPVRGEPALRDFKLALSESGAALEGSEP